MSEEMSGSENVQTGDNEGRCHVVQKISRIVLLTAKLASHLWPRYSIYNAVFFFIQ